MALTNQTIGAGGITGGTHSIQLQDSAQRIRFYDLAFLTEGAGGANGFTQSRPGVLAGSVDTSGTVPTAMLCAPTGTGLNISVRPGPAVVERSTLVGSYVVAAYQSGQVTLATADSTNPRIDRVDLQVLDGALGDNGGTSLTQYVVTTGVAAGTPTVPAAPANSIPLSQVLLPANTTTLTSGMFTDKRRSAGVRGATRFMLPGDALSDPGYVFGEKRQRLLSSYAVNGVTPTVTDYWGSDASWHGMAELALPAGSIVAAGPVTSSGWPITEAVAWTLTIPDPGYAYFVDLDAFSYRNAVTGANDYGQLKCRKTNLSGSVLRQTDMFTVSSGFAAGVSLRAQVWNGTTPGTPFTGATTLVVTANANSVNQNVMTSAWCSATVKPV